MYDRNMNGELEEIQAKRNLETATEEGKKMYNQMVEENHMVFKTGNIKSLSFEEVPGALQLTQGSQPFIGDVNGD